MSPSTELGAVPAAAYDRRAVVSWALYDLANTIYYAIVVTAFFPRWFERTYGMAGPIGITTAVTLLASGVVSPWLGGRVDRTGRARPGLDGWTALSAAATAALCFAAPAGVAPALAVYALSLFAYQAALTFYNALLPAVAPPDRRGFVSALGTGLGYAGVPLALWLGLLVSKTSLGAPGAFLVAAGMFALGTVPLWLFVKDRPASLRSAGSERDPAGGEGLLPALRRIAADRRLLLLLVANFVCADVANTLIQWATLYFTKSAGLSDDAAVYMMMGLSVTAFAGGIVIGRFADRVSPTLLYLGCCLGLLAGLLGAALAPGRAWATGLLVLTGGVGVAGIWSVGRQLVLVLSPPERYGEALGLYGVTVKMSIVGTAVFGIVVDAVSDPAWKYPAAILVEAACLVVGCLMIWSLHRELRARAPARAARA